MTQRTDLYSYGAHEFTIEQDGKTVRTIIHMNYPGPGIEPFGDECYCETFGSKKRAAKVFAKEVARCKKVLGR